MPFDAPADFGYNRSSSAKSAGGGDVMTRDQFKDLFDMNDEGKTLGRQNYLDMFDRLKAGPSPIAMDASWVPDAINPHEQQQTFVQSLIQGNTREKSLMEIMRPDDCKAGKYKASISGGAQSLMRDKNKVITDGEKVSDKRIGAQQDVKDAKDNFQTDFKKAHDECMSSFVEACKNEDVDPLSTYQTMFGEAAASKATAAVYIGGELAFGAGSLATAAKAGYVGSEVQLSKKEKQLPVEQQERILKATLEQLKNPSPASQDTRADSVGAIEAAVEPEGSVAKWEGFEEDDVAELLAADPLGRDQPEYAALMDLEYQIEKVEDNHKDCVTGYGEVATYDKMVHAAATGDAAIGKILNEATVLDTIPVRAAAVQDTAPSMSLAGDSVSQLEGVKVTADDVGIDAKSHSSHFEASLVNEPDLQRLLQANMANQFKV